LERITSLEDELEKIIGPYDYPEKKEEFWVVLVAHRPTGRHIKIWGFGKLMFEDAIRRGMLYLRDVDKINISDNTEMAAMELSTEKIVSPQSWYEAADFALDNRAKSAGLNLTEGGSIAFNGSFFGTMGDNN